MDMTTIINESFTQYAGAVLQSRALVDVRDCLKPSARQIFYCLYTDGFLPNKPFKKTLKAIGSVARMYIHGDSSAEGTIMRSGQPFAMRYPLVEIEGNDGTLIQSGNWAAPRYCVSGDTLVNTSLGLIPIEEIVKTDKNSDNPLDKTVYFKGINKITSSDLIFNSGEQPCLKITLKNGMDITGTYNHPLLTLDDQMEFCWKTLEDLEVGDKVLVNLCHNLVFPENTPYNDTAMARALGCLVSEGCLTQENKIDMINSDLDLIYPVQEILKRYGSKVQIRKRNQPDQCYELSTTNKALYNELKLYKCCYPSKDKKIPTYILRGTYECQIEFLRYLFEGDGCISIKEGGYGTISYSSISKQLIKELQILLASNFGIMSSIHTGTDKNEIKLELGGEDVYLFYKKIGFVSQRKQTLLTQAAEYYEKCMNKKSTGSRGWHIYKEIKEYLEKYYREANLIVYRQERANECKGPLMSKAGLPILKKKLNFRDYNKIENLYYNYSFVEIKSKEDAGVQVVYSPKINESTNEFTSNGMISHNTSSRLSPFSTCLFEDVNKDTIKDWRDNYDNTEKYPSVLPTKGFYNIVNGTLGIGIGASSSIPQFNLKDVNKALEVLLLNPDTPFEEIYCPPDFATGAYLINEEDVKESLKNGTGSACRLRAKMEYDDKDNCLVVTEIPYSVYTNTICKELEAILESEENPGVDRFNDLTGTTPNIKIYLKKGVNIKKITSYLYKNTSLQSFYSVNMTMLDDGRFPRVFTWKETLLAHISHECQVYRNGFQFDWNKIHNKIHIINGLLICLASIDEVVATIKKSNSTAEASKALQENFKLDAEQAKAVLDMKLSRLAHLEVEKLKNEKEELQKELDRLTTILNDRDLFNQELIKGWRRVAEKYGDEHRTKIITISEDEEKEEMELPNPEEVVIIVSQNNGVRRIPAKNFKIQKRNGKGVKSEDEAVLDTISTNTIDSLMCFTDKGRMYKLLVDDVPESAKFYPISGLTTLEGEEKVIAVNSLYRKSKAQYVVFFTKNGLVKKTLLEEYMKVKRGKGIAAIKLADNDSIANVVFMDEEDVILATKQGMSIRFETKSISPIGRVSMGVKGIKLNDDDEVICGIPVKDDNSYIAIVTDIGLAKKTAIKEFTPQGRGGKGIVAYKLSDTSGKIVSAMALTNEDSVLLIGKPSSICIAATDIPELGRVSSGNMMIKSSHIVCAIKM